MSFKKKFFNKNNSSNKLFEMSTISTSVLPSTNLLIQPIISSDETIAHNKKWSK
jgi:hypothetical protein